MTKVKAFRVEGGYTKGHQKYVFRKEKRAITEEDAVELVLSEITSIGIYRRQVRNLKVTELKKDEIRDPLILQLMDNQ
jgi:ribosomal protein L20A (L18A)